MQRLGSYYRRSRGVRLGVAPVEFARIPGVSVLDGRFVARALVAFAQSQAQFLGATNRRKVVLRGEGAVMERFSPGSRNRCLDA